MRQKGPNIQNISFKSEEFQKVKDALLKQLHETTVVKGTGTGCIDFTAIEERIKARLKK